MSFSVKGTSQQQLRLPTSLFCPMRQTVHFNSPAWESNPFRCRIIRRTAFYICIYGRQTKNQRFVCLQHLYQGNSLFLQISDKQSFYKIETYLILIRPYLFHKIPGTNFTGQHTEVTCQMIKFIIRFYRQILTFRCFFISLQIRSIYHQRIGYSIIFMISNGSSKMLNSLVILQFTYIKHSRISHGGRNISTAPCRFPEIIIGFLLLIER